MKTIFSMFFLLLAVICGLLLSACNTTRRVAYGTGRAGEHVVHGTGRAVSHVGHGVAHVGDEIAEHTR
jgi:predicted small secreted protein